MLATEILKEEHRVIERVLSSLEAATARLDAGEQVRPGFFIDAADFVRGFADGCHHKKEEGVLFEALVLAGLPRQVGPVGVMLADHEQGRAFTAGMREAAERLAGGQASARFDVIRNARGYTSLLRQHIHKEDNVLFPMADEMIPAEQAQRLSEDFDNIEHFETGEGVHEKYLALANALEREAGEQPG